MNYEAVPGYGSSRRPEPSELANFTAGRQQSNSYPGEASSIDMAPELTYLSEEMESHYGMTTLREEEGYAGTVGGLEGFDEQRYGPRPGFDDGSIMGSDPYSYTDRNDSFDQPYTLELPELGSQLVPSYQQIDVPRDRGPPQQIINKSEANYTASRCTYEGCRSTHVFRTMEGYNTHVKKIHHKEIYCLVPSCIRSHTDPFGSQTDRRRHHTAIHNREQIKTFRCKIIACRARVKAWHRKDKLLAHEKKYHHFLCHICSRIFASFEDLTQHTNFDHVSSIPGYQTF